MRTTRRHAIGTIATAVLGGLLPWRDGQAQITLPPASETAAYLAAYNRFGMVAELAKVGAGLAGKEVLFVPGFRAREIQASGLKTQACNIPASQYFLRQRDWLRTQSVAGRYLDLDSEAAVDANGDAIAQALATATDGSVLLVTHSKGCLDGLAAFIRQPAVQRKVAAWVALQGPFHGAAIADALSGVAGLEGAGALLPGSVALADMRRSARAAYLAANGPAIGTALKQVPTICYGSVLGSSSCLIRMSLASTTAGDALNDGMVSPSSALLDGAMQVVETEVDHGMPVLGTSDTLDSVRCLMALVAVRLNIA